MMRPSALSDSDDGALAPFASWARVGMAPGTAVGEDNSVQAVEGGAI